MLSRLALGFILSCALRAEASELIDGLSAESVVGAPHFLNEKQVVYAVDKGGRIDVMIRNLDLGKSYRYTSHPLDDRLPKFSPTGDYVAWVGQRNDVKGDLFIGELPVDGKPRRVTNSEVGVESFAWSHNGDALFYVTRDPFLDTRRGFYYPLETKRPREVDVRVSRVVAGCRQGEWILVSDASVDESVVYRYQAQSDEAAEVIRLPGRVSEMVGLRCTPGAQEIYVATLDSVDGRGEGALGLGVLSVPQSGDLGFYEHLIGEELPRFDLSVVGDALVGRARVDARQFVRAAFGDLAGYSVEKVSIESLASLTLRERLNVLDAKEIAGELGSELAGFYRFLSLRDAKQAVEASDQLEALWQRGCQEAYEVAGVYLRREVQEPRDACADADAWRARMAFARADQLMFLGEIEKSNVAFTKWLSLENDPLLRFIGLTRWTRLMHWINPLDALLQVLDIVERQGVVLDAIEKEWFFDGLLAQFKELSPVEYRVVSRQWPSILNESHLATSLGLMVKARRLASANAWTQAFAQAASAGKFFESPAGEFARKWQVTQWMLLSGAPRRALAMLQTLEEDFPKEKEALRALRAELRRELGNSAEKAVERGDANTAYALYSQLLILEPYDLELNRQLLAQAKPAGFLGQKIAQFDSAVREKTSGWLDHYLLGLALTFVGPEKWVLAEKQLRRAQQLQPQSIDVTRTLSWVLLNRRGRLTDRLRRAEEVIDIVERQLSRMEEQAEGYRELEYSLSLALFRLGKFDRALSILKRFENDFPDPSSERSAYLSLRADLAYRNNDTPAAIAWIQRLIKDESLRGLDLRIPELRARLGVLYYDSGNLQAALAELDRARQAYLDLGKGTKARRLQRIVNLLGDRPLGEPLGDGRKLEAWKWSLSGIERRLYIASTRAAAGEPQTEEGLSTEQESAEEMLSTDTSAEPIQSKGVTIAPYGDERHWYQWSRATADYNRRARTFDLDAMEVSLRERIATLRQIWSEGVLEFKYLQEVRDLIFDTLDLLIVRATPVLTEQLGQLLSELPTGVRATPDWKTLSVEIEAFVLRDLGTALSICNLVPYLNLGESSTLKHSCNVSSAVMFGGQSLEQDLEIIDRLIQTRGEPPGESLCSADRLYETWSTRGFLPTDTVVLGRLLRDCESLDAWVRTELVVGFESVAYQRRSSNRANASSAITSEQITEALVWALDENVVYLGGIETDQGWWFLEVGDGQTQIRRLSAALVEQRLAYWADRTPVLSNSLAKFTHSLKPATWRFSHSFLAYWEEETWEGPAFIAVPESRLSVDQCMNSDLDALKYESLVIGVSEQQSLSEALLLAEKCLRQPLSFQRVVFEYDTRARFGAQDFERVVHLFQQKRRFPVDAIMLASGEMKLHLGPLPAQGDVWVRVWNEHFQPLFAAGLNARRVQQSNASEESHQKLVSDVEKIVRVLDGLRATDVDVAKRYTSLNASRGTMFQQIISRLDTIRSQFLTWSVASYEALGDIIQASAILEQLLKARAWNGDAGKLGLWSRKQASFLVSLHQEAEALAVLEACWLEGVVDCGVELGSRYLSQASYREAERIGDGLVGVSDNSRANVEGIDILARIAEQERYDFDAAVELLMRAYAVSNDVDVDLRVRLSINLMRVARLAGEYQTAETLGNSIALWELTTDQRLRVELTRAQTWYVSGQARKAVRAMAKLTNLAEDIGDHFTKMLCTSLWALSSLEVGRYQDAERLAVSALKQAESLGSRREIANQLNNLGLVYSRIGKHEDAAKALNQAMTSDFTGRDTMSLAYSMRNLGQQKILARDPKVAAGLLEEAAYLSRKTGDRINEARARFSLLLNKEELEERALGEAFWRLSEDAKDLRLVEIQWRSLFGAYRYLEASLSESEALTLLEEIFSVSMSHIGLASERLGPGRRDLRNEYHYRLMQAGRPEDALRVALRFAQPRSQRGLTKPLELKTLQERLRPEEALWYGWFDKRGWKGWIIGQERSTFVMTDWDQAETDKVFADLTQRLKEYAPLGRSLDLLSGALSFLMKGQLEGIETLKILDVPGEAWIPYRALKIDGVLLDERLKLQWTLPILVEKEEKPETLAFHLTDEFSDRALVFAALEQTWLREHLGQSLVESDALFAVKGQLHMTGHFNGLGRLEDAWFRQELSEQTVRWPSRIFVNTCGPDGNSVQAQERYGALVTALQNGTTTALTHRLRVSDWAAAVLAKQYYQAAAGEEPSEVARQATRFVRRMFRHPAHWAGFEVITGL